MKTTYARRYRRSSSSAREAKMFKKDNQPEATFFGGPSHESFFKPNVAIQRKCASCEAEEKKVHRMGGEEEKKIQKMGEKKEEEVHRQPDHKEEEKKIQKMGEKKEEVVHRQADHKEEEKKIAKKESSAANAGLAATGAYIQSLNGKGNALPKDALHFFGKKMGYDFSGVKIHTGAEAEQSAKNVNAKAYAVDNNIVFNKGQYNPASAEGKKLLAHELTHVIQQKENAGDILSRVTENTEPAKETGPPPDVTGAQPANAQNTAAKKTTSKGCANAANVQGQTDANYTDSFKFDSNSNPSKKCSDCVPPDCVTVTGTIVSEFKANPVINLPPVPNGLTDCEATAVDKFINTTLKTHEQRHVAAFKTYDGKIKTPYNFTGCQSDLDSFIQAKHDAIKTQRQASADAKSVALDTPPFNPTIPCDC